MSLLRGKLKVCFFSHRCQVFLNFSFRIDLFWELEIFLSLLFVIWSAGFTEFIKITRWNECNSYSGTHGWPIYKLMRQWLNEISANCVENDSRHTQSFHWIFSRTVNPPLHSTLKKIENKLYCTKIQSLLKLNFQRVLSVSTDTTFLWELVWCSSSEF